MKKINLITIMLMVLCLCGCGEVAENAIIDDEEHVGIEEAVLSDNIATEEEEYVIYPAFLLLVGDSDFYNMDCLEVTVDDLSKTDELYENMVKEVVVPESYKYCSYVAYTDEENSVTIQIVFRKDANFLSLSMNYDMHGENSMTQYMQLKQCWNVDKEAVNMLISDDGKVSDGVHEQYKTYEDVVDILGNNGMLEGFRSVRSGRAQFSDIAVVYWYYPELEEIVRITFDLHTGDIVSIELKQYHELDELIKTY